MNFYEVPSGKLSNQWTQHGENTRCPRKPLLFLNKPPYRFALAQATVVGEDAIFLWDTWTGEQVRRIRVAPYSLATRPSVSANGRYVVAGTWNDPQDNPITQASQSGTWIPARSCTEHLRINRLGGLTPSERRCIPHSPKMGSIS